LHLEYGLTVFAHVSTGGKTTMRIGSRFLLALVVTIAIGASPARADTIALQSFSGGLLATSGTDQLYGWEFDVLTTIQVTALGVGDFDDPGLAIAHDVGIFRTSDEALLTSVTIPAGTSATLTSGFRYVSLPSIETLLAGRYVIVMTMPAIMATDRAFSTRRSGRPRRLPT
jgi:hypothetical protein